LEEMSKNMNSNFELLLKTIHESPRNVGDATREDVGDIEPSYVENPRISQPQYIKQYRESLRGQNGLKSFMGYNTELRGDNLGSYV
jgi:hypothetical protein